METKSTQFLNIRYPARTEPKLEKFPSTRYFQVHFEYVEEQLAETRSNLASIQAQMEDLSKKLTFLITEINRKNHK